MTEEPKSGTGNFLVIITHLEEPKLLLVRDTELKDLELSLRNDPLLRNRIGWIHSMSVSPHQHSNLFKGITLARHAHTESRGAFELHLAEAIYYASISGIESQIPLLKQGLQVLMNRLKEAQAQLQTFNSVPSPGPEPSRSLPTGK
jgi:hypothetical protein